MHKACHNVYTLTAHVTGFRTVLVTPEIRLHRTRSYTNETLHPS